MTIIQLCKYYAPHLGGVETHVQALNAELVKQGHQVWLITEQHDAQLAAKESLVGVKIWRIPQAALKSKFKTWQWFWRHQDLLLQADVIQVHDVFWWLGPVYPTIRGRVFTTFHGWETRYPVAWQAKLHRWLAAQLSRATVHVGAWIQEFYWDRPTAITYGGIRPERPLKKSSAQLGKTWQTVFLGRLSLDNEVDKYIEVIHHLKAAGQPVEVTWVGDGPLASLCQRVGKVTGMVQQPGRYIQSADLVFASSYLSLLEAQAQGKLVAALYSHTLKRRYLETFPGSSGLIMAGESSLLARQLQLIMVDKAKRQTLVAAGQTWARQQTWAKVLEMYQRLWQQRG